MLRVNALVSRILGGLRGLLRKRQVEQDLDDELRQFVEAAEARHRAAGLSARAAARAARLEIGSMEAVKDQIRDAGWERSTETFWQDIRYAVRLLRASAGFTVVVTLTLSLAIGASLTIFSVMHAVLWRPLPYPQADRLVTITRSFGPASGGLSPGEALELRSSSHAFTRVAQANGVDAFVAVGDEMTHVSAASATDDMLELVGAVPLALGRPLRAATDIRAGRVVAAVISNRLWRQIFHGDPGAVGRHVDINNLDVEVVGVTPAGLRTWLPAGTTPSSASVSDQVDVWFPNVLDDSPVTAAGPVVIARLAPGVTLARAQAELDLFARQLLTEHGAEYADAAGPLRLHVQALRDVVTAPASAGLMTLGAAVAAVLLIGCVNVANLMLARGKTREREIALRSALGASRARLVRQVLTETLVLTAIGAAGGLLFGRVGIDLLAWLRPAHLPRQPEISIDLTVMSAAVVLALLTTIVCGLLPAVRVSKARGTAPLVATRSATSAAGRPRLQRVLVVTEVALSIVPLVAAGLMLRTFANLATAPLGFDPSRIVTARVPYRFDRFPDVASRWALQREVLSAVRRLPGVEDVSAASPLPFAEVQFIRRFRRAGDPTDQGYAAVQQTVTPGYLQMTGTQLVKGRELNDDDVETRREVAIVDERFAEMLWHGPAMGQRFVVGSGQGRHVLEVVGVTRPVRMTHVRDDPMPHVFLPYHIFPVELTLVVKTGARAQDIAAAIKRTIEALGTGRAVYDIKPMTAYVEASIDDTRFLMLVLSAFAIASLLLAGIGLYGTLAYLISQRTQEFGVRIALGASPAGVVRLVASEAAVMAGSGALLGMAGAFGATGLLRHLLYGVTPFDGVTVAAVTVVVGLAAVGAVIRPAWRAAHVDPSTALRSE